MSVFSVRPVLAVVITAGILVAGAASAAPKPTPKPAATAPVCNLVQDAKGDTFAARYQETVHDLGGPGVYGPPEPALDIVSADIAADAKTITAVIRVDKLDKKVQSAPGGTAYRVQFATPSESDENLYLNAATDGSTDTFTAGTRAITANVGTQLAEVTGVFDLAKSEIRISAPIATFAAQGVKADTELSLKGLDQTASRGIAAGRAAFADVATSDKTYKVGAPSCVVPGK